MDEISSKNTNKKYHLATINVLLVLEKKKTRASETLVF